MTTFSVAQARTRVNDIDATLLRLSFGDPSPNDLIVREVDARMRQLKGEQLGGGRLVLINGPASLPVIAVIVHHVAHLFGAVAVYDPKLRGYVVVVAHGPGLEVGELLPAEDEVAE